MSSEWDKENKGKNGGSMEVQCGSGLGVRLGWYIIVSELCMLWGHGGWEALYVLPYDNFSFIKNHIGSVSVTFSSVQLLSCVQLFETPWTAAFQASLSFTISQNLFKLMSTELMTPPNPLILCHFLPLLPSIFPSIRIFANELPLPIRWPKYGASASAWLLPVKIQDWFPLG